MRSLRALLAALALALPAPALAQKAVTSAFEGFSGRSDQPVKIEADRLEVRETDQAAVFSGNVLVAQGDSSLSTRKLTVFYESDGPGTAQATGDVQSARNIRRLEAEGAVVVRSKDQRATGDRGVFDMPSNTVTVTGNVVLSQGPNVLKGDRLVVDLTTQQSRIESSGSGRVQGVFGPRPAQP
jgi:lipopolysaccharide export system protein LptA